MKRIFTYIAMLLVAAGCTLDQKREYDPDMQLCFQPVMQVPTKVDLKDNYPAGQPFSVSAWTLDKELSWSENAAEADMYLSGATVIVNDNDVWSLPDKELWPSRDKRLTVIGYSPVEAFGECSVEKGATCTYDIMTGQDDLLYTEPQTDLDKVECGGTMIMPFYHALSQMNFEVKNRVRKEEEIIVKSIKVDGVKHCGSFTSLPTPEWETEDSETQLVFFEGAEMTTNNPSEIGQTWNMIPQLLDTKVTVEYEYRTASNTGFTQTLKTCDLNTNLKPGRRYTYTITVGIDEVQFLLEIIEDRFR